MQKHNVNSNGGATNGKPASSQTRPVPAPPARALPAGERLPVVARQKPASGDSKEVPAAKTAMNLDLRPNSATRPAGIAPGSSTASASSQEGRSQEQIAAAKAAAGSDSADGPESDLPEVSIDFDPELLTKKSPRRRPHFMPESVSFEGLPLSLQKAFEEIVIPVHEQLVVGQSDPLAKAVGMTVGFEVMLELVSQLEITNALFQDDADHTVIESAKSQLDKSVKRKMKGADFLQRREEMKIRKLSKLGTLGTGGVTP